MMIDITQTRTMLAVPIKIKDRAIGVIEAINPGAGFFDVVVSSLPCRWRTNDQTIVLRRLTPYSLFRPCD